MTAPVALDCRLLGRSVTSMPPTPTMAVEYEYELVTPEPCTTPEQAADEREAGLNEQA